MNRARRAALLSWRFAQAALLVLAAMLPFELEAPLARLGPLQLSSVEVFLYVALAAWVVARLARAWWAGARPRLADWLPSDTHRALLGLALVMVLSAATAPLMRASALKFTLRSLGGLALFGATADLLAAPRAVARAAVAVAIGASVAALLMVAEIHVPGAARHLLAFHPQTFQSFGLLRASGPFEYPNIAAMYLEAALPLLLATVTLGRARRGARPRFVLTVLAALLLLYAILLAGSRAGIVTALLELIALAILARPNARLPSARTLRYASITAIVLGIGALAMTFFVTDPLLALRLQVWQTRPWYRSAMSAAPDAGRLPRRMAPGSTAEVGLAVRNEGAIAWPREGPHRIFLSYHWDDATSGDTVVFEGLRTVLPHDVPPDGQVTITAGIQAPARPGRYVVHWDLVQDGVTWFSAYGDSGATQGVEVGRRDNLAENVRHRRLGARRGRGGRSGLRDARKGAGAADSDRGESDAFESTGDDDTMSGDSDRRGSADMTSSLAVSPPAGVPRSVLWRAALAAWRDHPLLGLGPDNFRHAFGGYLGLTDADERLHANNMYIEMLATLGSLGFLAFVAVLVALGRAARRALAVPETRLFALGVATGLGAYLIHGVLDYFLEFTPTYALMWLQAGMLVALGRQASAPIGDAAGDDRARSGAGASLAKAS